MGGDVCAGRLDGVAGGRTEVVNSAQIFTYVSEDSNKKDWIYMNLMYYVGSLT